MTTKRPFHLVERSISTETVECLETLLDHAKKGDLIGIAYAVMYEQRGYFCSAAGEAHRSPTYTRGMLCALDDKLRTKVKA